MNKIYIKSGNINVETELKSIGFDSSYLTSAEKKYSGKLYKIFNLKPYEANILKQICLSLGFDCAVSKDSITCNCEKTDALIFATQKQISQMISKLYVQPFRLKKIAVDFKSILNNKKESLIIRNTTFDWSRPYIMGILNVTPDSFSDGGKFSSIEKAVAQAKKLICDSADIIDIGGETTKPNADAISVDEEINRVIPVISEIRKFNNYIPISVDTRNYKTAQLAIQAGADIINDVSGLDFDKKLLDFVVNENIPTVIMHSDNVPAISKDFTSSDIVEQTYLSLYKKKELLISLGMKSKNIIFDVGIGFGKSLDSNFELLKRINEFESLNQPLLLGISRKSFIRNSFNIDFDEADIPTALYSSMLSNVNIHRVHNVELTKKFINFANKLF